MFGSRTELYHGFFFFSMVYQDKGHVFGRLKNSPEPCFVILERSRAFFDLFFKVFLIDPVINLKFPAAQGIGYADEDAVKLKRLGNIVIHAHF